MLSRRLSTRTQPPVTKVGAHEHLTGTCIQEYSASFVQRTRVQNSCWMIVFIWLMLSWYFSCKQLPFYLALCSKRSPSVQDLAYRPVELMFGLLCPGSVSGCVLKWRRETQQPTHRAKHRRTLRFGVQKLTFKAWLNTLNQSKTQVEIVLATTLGFSNINFQTIWTIRQVHRWRPCLVHATVGGPPQLIPVGWHGVTLTGCIGTIIPLWEYPEYLFWPMAKHE
jgi:hypothetical protein